MSDDPARFTGSIPEHYDRELGPVLFVDYAADMARLVAARSPARVLETAAGTGIVTRALRDALPPDTHITATDLNPPMLDIAAKKIRAGEAVGFQPADAQDLPFGDGSFDAVVCQFGIMFFPERDRGYREARRVLAPGGRYFFSVWDAQHYNAYARIMSEVAARAFPVDPPQFYHVPFSCAAIDPIKEGLIAAGFDGIEVRVIRREKAIPDLAAFARGLVFGNPMADQVRARGRDPEGMVETVHKALRREFGDPARMTMQAMLYEAGRG